MRSILKWMLLATSLILMFLIGSSQDTTSVHLAKKDIYRSYRAIDKIDSLDNKLDRLMYKLDSINRE